MLKDFLICLTKVVMAFLLVVVCTLMYVAGVVYLVPATSAVLVEELSASVDLLPMLVSWAPAALAATVLEVAGMLAATRALRRVSVKLSNMLCERIEKRFGESEETDAVTGSNDSGKSNDSNKSAKIKNKRKHGRKKKHDNKNEDTEA